MSNAVEAYFSSLRDIYNSGAGVPETSYYNPLSTLLNEVGHKLKPKVSAIINLRNTGAGIPDGGLFTAPQLRGLEPGIDPLSGQLPNRGAIEVKGTSDDAFQIAQGDQVARYVERYGLVLVTNLRDFVLVGRNADGSGVRELESIRLATNEGAFWGRVQQPRKYAEDAGEGLTEFLRRVLLHNAPLSDPKDVAWFLASYARTARLRLESRHELPALAQLRSQLEESLGLKFEGDKGDHFFRSTLVQTLFYGMFASWVLWARDKDRSEVIPWDRRFQWETASQTLHVPMVAELFYQFSNPGRLRDLHIDEVLEWAEEVLWRVDRESFFAKFQEEHAVQYFYEPFLEAFDPQLRKELGVWYTPDEVVKYMVARVDWALREELGIADGLADPSVVVLDPCCGTGAFLVEVLRKIDQTLQGKGADALTRQDVKRAALQRVIGFEIMPAPYVIAHLQMGVLLAELGVPLKDERERAAVYLTNALTGWADGGALPPKDKRAHPDQMYATTLFPEFAEERDAANRIKREEPILVIVGNPPYNGYAGVAVDEERALSDAYRTVRKVAAPVGAGLNDPFVRFYRMAERRIIDMSGQGVVCLVTNSAWLEGPSFTGMRERFCDVFDKLYIDNLNGDKYKTGKTTPEGKPDPSVFSTEHNREGIQVGTAIACLVRRKQHVIAGSVAYRDLWGEGKRRELAAQADDDSSVAYHEVHPPVDFGLPFVAAGYEQDFGGWPRLDELIPRYFAGVMTSRDDFLVDTNREALVSRVGQYFDSSVRDDLIGDRWPSVMRDSRRFDAHNVRSQLLSRGPAPGRVVRYAYRPFDSRWLYWDPDTKLLDEKRADYVDDWQSDAWALVTTGRTRKGELEPPVVVNQLVDRNFMDSGARVFPAAIASVDLMSDGGARANLSAGAIDYVSGLGLNLEDLLLHCVAVLSAPEYRIRNVGAVRHVGPSVPLPATGEALLLSSVLGDRIRQLQIAERVDLTALAPVGSLSSATAAALDADCDLAVTARWGIRGKDGICMPAAGHLAEREYSDAELAAIRGQAGSSGPTPEEIIRLLGATCFDIYLNDVAYWSCVPANVWRYTIGGYQVIKKWLSYREKALLGRDLKPEEARYVTEMVRRIAALILMQPELDANYERVKADTYDWKQA